TVRRRVRSFERSSSRIGDLHANDVNRPFASSACFAQGREAISEQASEQDFADATREQISVGVPVDGFREEAKGAKQIRSFHDRWYPPPCLCHLGVPPSRFERLHGLRSRRPFVWLWIPSTRCSSAPTPPGTQPWPRRSGRPGVGSAGSWKAPPA